METDNGLTIKFRFCEVLIGLSR